MTIHRARVEVSSWDVAVTPPRREEMADNDREAPRLEITGKLLDWLAFSYCAGLELILVFLPSHRTGR